MITAKEPAAQTKIIKEGCVFPPASVHHNSEDDYFGVMGDCGEDEDLAEDSDDGFMADDEYDSPNYVIIDASDEEYFSEQQHILTDEEYDMLDASNMEYLAEHKRILAKK
ncbi:Uu.00g105370.m01.CDS01 [Anthostomella pinea]|uniref:Uu.00g105370.m01.CDS01 n=1 Tax=Anthostomella pinea TaxID=933095 RepID=A0AAI8VEW3_9PEZI|nr:Uu.00g105370.m01.CDS01 [Anthostomella pinea]